MDIQVGDLVIFEGGIVKLIYDMDRLFEINQYINGGGSQILKIERPHYEVVEEKKELLTEEERKYLSDIIRPFRDRVKGIEKRAWDKKEYIYIYLIEEIGTSFPYFEPNTIYKNMKLHKKYSLKELGLEEN